MSDWRENCPEDSWTFQIEMRAIWTLGAPTFIVLSMWWHGVLDLVKRKIERAKIPGTKWKKMRRPETGTPIVNEQLEAFLSEELKEGRTYFNPSELNQFEKHSLSFNSCINVEGRFFQPTRNSEWEDNPLDEEERKFKERFPPVCSYKVDKWWWFMFDMCRQLLTISILFNLYRGTTEHLLGALLITFCFLIIHLWVKPYQNMCLNRIQGLVLLTQVMTIFDCLYNSPQISGPNDENENEFQQVAARSVKKGLNWIAVAMNAVTICTIPPFIPLYR